MEHLVERVATSNIGHQMSCIPEEPFFSLQIHPTLVLRTLAYVSVPYCMLWRLLSGSLYALSARLP